MKTNDKEEYIIISKTKILNRIEETKKPIAHYDGIYVSMEQHAEVEALEKTLSQSVPLIPEIDKAYDAGTKDKELSHMFDNPKGRFLSTFKLDM